jgi:tetratricopeptide (TPR) repeat protein
MAARLSANLGQCIVICFALIGQVLWGAETWTRWTTPNFDFYSTLPRKQNALLLRQLESARQGLQQLTITGPAGSLPLRVIAFRSQEEYGRYCSNATSTAYYLHSNYRNYIVMGEEASESVTPAVHEYVHHVIHQRFSHLPLWLDEGLADVYSTVEIKDGNLRLGLPLENRLRWLQMDGFNYNTATLWNLRLSSFSNVQHVTPRSRFYAESWLMVHMLKFSPMYASRFNELLRDLEHGSEAQQVFLQLYNKTPEAVDQDLQSYLKAEWLPTQLLPVHEASIAAGSATGVSSGEAHATLADLLSALGRFEQAQAELSSEAVARSAHQASVQEAWGYYYLRQGRLAEAREHMAQALQLGTDDARGIYDAANLLLSNGTPVAQVIPVLERAVALRPGFLEAKNKLEQLRASQPAFVQTAAPDVNGEIAAAGGGSR